jgi:hypothetical protein
MTALMPAPPTQKSLPFSLILRLHLASVPAAERAVGGAALPLQMVAAFGGAGQSASSREAKPGMAVKGGTSGDALRAAERSVNLRTAAVTASVPAAERAVREAALPLEMVAAFGGAGRSASSREAKSELAVRGGTLWDAFCVAERSVNFETAAVTAPETAIREAAPPVTAGGPKE